jgi:hypothetical protein
MTEDIVLSVGRHRSWVAYPYISDHAPVALQFDDGQRKVSYPFKLNHIWLGEVGFSVVVHKV